MKSLINDKVVFSLFLVCLAGLPLFPAQLYAIPPIDYQFSDAPSSPPSPEVQKMLQDVVPKILAAHLETVSKTKNINDLYKIRSTFRAQLSNFNFIDSSFAVDAMNRLDQAIEARVHELLSTIKTEQDVKDSGFDKYVRSLASTAGSNQELQKKLGQIDSAQPANSYGHIIIENILKTPLDKKVSAQSEDATVQAIINHFIARSPLPDNLAGLTPVEFEYKMASLIASQSYKGDDRLLMAAAQAGASFDHVLAEFRSGRLNPLALPGIPLSIMKKIFSTIKKPFPVKFTYNINEVSAGVTSYITPYGEIIYGPTKSSFVGKNFHDILMTPESSIIVVSMPTETRGDRTWFSSTLKQSTVAMCSGALCTGVEQAGKYVSTPTQHPYAPSNAEYLGVPIDPKVKGEQAKKQARLTAIEKQPEKNPKYSEVVKMQLAEKAFTTIVSSSATKSEKIMGMKQFLHKVYMCKSCSAADMDNITVALKISAEKYNGFDRELLIKSSEAVQKIKKKRFE